MEKILGRRHTSTLPLWSLLALALLLVVLFVLIMTITLIQRRFFGDTPSWA